MANDDIAYDLEMDVDYREDSEIYIKLFRKEYPHVPSSVFIEKCEGIKSSIIDGVMFFCFLPLLLFVYSMLLPSSFFLSLNAASPGAAAMFVMFVTVALFLSFPLTYAFLHRNDRHVISELAGPFRLACEKEGVPKQHYEKFIASVTEPPIRTRTNLPGGCYGSGNASATSGGC